MKAYRFITGTRISPFGDEVSESQVGNCHLGRAVTIALKQAGLCVHPGQADGIDDDCLILSDTVFVTRQAIIEFIRACPQGEGIFRLGIRKGPLTRWLCPLAKVDTNDDSVMFDCYIVRKHIPRAGLWKQLQQYLSRSSQTIILDPGSIVETIPIPSPPGSQASSAILLPRTDLVVADVSHWVHLVWLNQLMAWIGLNERDEKKNSVGSIIGKHCDIHPSAHVENSIIGNGVKIGPFSSVIDSVIGNRVELTESSRLKRCCIGHDCRTLPDSFFIGCTCYSGSTLANFMLRDSIIGRGCFVTSGLVFSSVGLAGPVYINIGGQHKSTGRWMLGSALGHGCTLGTLGNRGSIAPGMEIPNGYMIVMDPSDGLQGLPKNPNPLDPFMNIGGTAVRLAALIRETEP